MIKLGITGGIGSGKSILCSYLIHRGIPVYNCDLEAKRLMCSCTEIRSQITQLIGPESYQGDSLNRPYVASRIFADKALITALNAIVHPAVRADFLQWANRQNAPIVALEAAILLEGSFHTAVDYLLTVSAQSETRIRRVMQRDGLTRPEVEARMANQLPEEERNQRAHFVLFNEDDDALTPQIEAILEQL